MEEVEMKMSMRAAINAILVIIIGVLVVFATRMPFIHKKYEYVNSVASPEYKTLKATYKPILKQRDSSLNQLIRKLQKDEITKDEFIVSFKEIKGTSKIKLEAFNSKRLKLLKKYKYRGWNAYYIFLLHIGTPIMAFILCLLFFYVLINPVTTKLKKIIFSIYGSLFLFSSSYMILHVLFANQVYKGDFPESWYINIMRYVPIFIALTLPLLFYHFQTFEQKLKGIIALFFSAIYKEIPNNDFIKPEKRKEYRDFKIELTDKVVGNE